MRLHPTHILATLSAALVAFAPAAHAAKWGAGTQREIRPGIYAKLIVQSDGWWLWKTENWYGSTCRIIKPSIGSDQPLPDGYDSFAGGDGAIMMEFGHEPGRTIGMTPTRRPTWSIKGAEHQADQAFRILGESEPRPFAFAPPVADIDGRMIEITIGGGAYERRAIIDMTGVSKALRLLADCDKAFGR